MGQLLAIPRETWLKPACLLASVIIHLGMVLVCWQSLRSLSVDNQPIVVALVERPKPVSVKPATGTLARHVPKLATPPRRPSALKTNPVTVTPPKDQQDTVPVAVNAGADLPAAAEDTGGGSPIDSGEGTGWEVGRGKVRARRTVADGLIKATPRIEFNATPDYPDIAREGRWEGTARVRARVTAAGDVESVFLERSSGHAMLDRSALDSVRQWRFIPATRNGVAVVSEVIVPVPFRLSE